jgi:hypothetical protein
VKNPRSQKFPPNKNSAPADIAKEIDLAFEDCEYVLSMPVHAGARNLVDGLYSNNYILLFTARPTNTKPWTTQWLDNHVFSVDDLMNVKEASKSLYRSDVLIDTTLKG